MQNPPPGKSALGLDANVVAGLCYVGNLVCYLGLILSIVTVVTDKTNKLARFHAFQSIFLSVVGLLLGGAYFVAAIIGAIIDHAIGTPAFTMLLPLLIGLLCLLLLIAMIIAAIKAFQGEIYPLPVVGKFAEQYA